MNFLMTSPHSEYVGEFVYTDEFQFDCWKDVHQCLIILTFTILGNLDWRTSLPVFQVAKRNTCTNSNMNEFLVLIYVPSSSSLIKSYMTLCTHSRLLTKTELARGTLTYPLPLSSWSICNQAYI